MTKVNMSMAQLKDINEAISAAEFSILGMEVYWIESDDSNIDPAYTISGTIKDKDGCSNDLVVTVKELYAVKPDVYVSGREIGAGIWLLFNSSMHQYNIPAQCSGGVYTYRPDLDAEMLEEVSKLSYSARQKICEGLLK